MLEENIASHKVLEKNGFKLVFKGIDKYQDRNRALRKYIFKIVFVLPDNYILDNFLSVRSYFLGEIHLLLFKLLFDYRKISHTEYAVGSISPNLCT